MLADKIPSEQGTRVKKRSLRFPYPQVILLAPLLTLLLLMLFMGSHTRFPNDSPSASATATIETTIRHRSERIYRRLRPTEADLQIHIEHQPLQQEASADITAVVTGEHLARLTWDTSGEGKPLLQSVTLRVAPTDGEGDRLLSRREAESAAQTSLLSLANEIGLRPPEQWIAERRSANWRVRLKGKSADFSVVLNAARGDVVGLWRENAKLPPRP